MSRSPSPYSSSSNTSADSGYQQDSRDIDELDRRSRKLTKILKRNIDKSQTRKSIMNLVREKAWLLEDQVKLIEKQTSDIKNRLVSRSFRRKLIILIIAIGSIGTIYYLWKPFDDK